MTEPDYYYNLWRDALERVSELRKAMRDIAAVNNKRDRYSAEIDSIIQKALETKCD